MDDLQLTASLRTKYPQVIWVTGKARKLPRQSGRVVVKLKFDISTGEMQAKVYAGVRHGTPWLRISGVEREIEHAMRNCTGDPRVVIETDDPRTVVNKRGIDLVEQGGGKTYRINSRWYECTWPDHDVKVWLRFATTTKSRMKKWSSEDKSRLLSSGLYAWVVQFDDDRNAVRLKYAFTTFETEWVARTPPSFLALVASACRYADSRAWHRMDMENL